MTSQLKEGKNLEKGSKSERQENVARETEVGKMQGSPDNLKVDIAILEIDLK